MRERKRIRLEGYDYSTDNLYFVTSCVHNRVCCFGKITIGETGRNDAGMGRNDAGTGRNDAGTGRNIVGTGLDPSLQQMVLNAFGKIAEKQWHWLGQQYPYVVLHAFVVMPNHIHGIIEINRNRTGGTGRDDVGMGRGPSIPKIKSLSELMGAYKTTVSKQIHMAGYHDFEWQRSFYDRIIRDEKSYDNISHYISDNPLKWDQDKFYCP